MAEEKNTPFAVRMDQEDKEKLLLLIQESGRSNKDFMNSLISAYELNKVKVEVPEAGESIRKVEELTQLINDYFVNMSKQIRTSKEAMTMQFTKDLDVYKTRLENLKEEKDKLENQIEVMQVSYNNSCEELDMVKGELETKDKLIEQLNESMKDVKALVEEYKSKNDMLTGMLKKYEKYPEEVEKLNKIITSIEKKNIELINSNKAKDEEIERLNKSKEDLKNNHISELNKLKEQIEFHCEKLMLEKEKEHQKNIKLINYENNEKVRELLKENQEYNSKVSRLMEENQDKNNKINEQTEIMKNLIAELEILRSKE